MTQPDPAFWAGRRVLVTGHTGFKGAWLALLLTRLGARVTGIALPPEPGPSLFRLLAGRLALEHRELDIREASPLAEAVRAAEPSVVLHLAAQALVRRSYRQPAETFATNVQGTVNLLQALRGLPGVAAAVMVTSDKVYRNEGLGRRFREEDPLGGEDPYSASKAACEIAVASWRAAFASELPPLVSARAGNVIGGGDFAEDRLIPDIVRSLEGGRPLLLRYPQATRPWQHVLDVLRGYLLQAEQAAAGTAPEALNFGPPEPEEVPVASVVEAIGEAFGIALPWRQDPAPPLKEAPRLALDPGLAMRRLGWRPTLDRSATIAATAAWYAAWRRGEDMARLSEAEAEEALS